MLLLSILPDEQFRKIVSLITTALYLKNEDVVITWQQKTLRYSEA